ncbi:MAG: hypothetical protein OXL34_17855 [Gemmatimonadota bacterium]|nr:hypothetical protein [Gemmatimonadota bacterium]
MRAFPFLVPVILALQAVMAAAPLPAQERPAKLAGCYDITAPEPDSANDPRLEIVSGAGFEGQVPPRIEFAGPFRGFDDRDTSRTQIVVPEGALPSVHRWMSGEIVGDSLIVGFSTGYGGVTATLGWAGDRWVGRARYFSDVGPPFDSDAGLIELAPVSCDSAPPVSIDAMVPIARSVELEDGLVVTLGEPIPEGLETTPALGTTLTVTGRTAGFFAGADSVAVAASDRYGVTQIWLYYDGPDAHSKLESRLRGAYGDPETDPRWGYHAFRNPITVLTLSIWGNGGAQVTLGVRS